MKNMISFWKLPLPQFFTKVLFLVALIFSIFFSLNYLSQPILERHGFRQAQTALTAYYLIKNGFSFAYWTPVIGEGWSIPFEFPIYQEIVAIATQILETSLPATGRIISFFFSLLCCFPIYFMLREAGVNKEARYFSLALFLSAPLYVFWGSTFMIESAALFFTLCFAFYAAKIVKRTALHRDYLFAFIFLALGLLQKITTTLPVLLIFSCACLWCFRLSDLKNNKAYIAKVFFTVAIPVAMAYVWVRFSDQIKLQNFIGSTLTSYGLKGWTYGNFDQRLSTEFWKEVIFKRVFSQNMFGILGILTIVSGFFLIQTKQRKILLLLLIAGFLPFLIFANLHIVHDYYQTANIVFLLMALGLAVVAISDRFLKKWPLAYCGFLSLFIFSNFYQFYSGYFIQRSMVITSENNRTLTVSNFVKKSTRDDDIVIWFGFEWSSETAFYSERKSLTVPYGWPNIDGAKIIENLSQYLSLAPAAIVLCSSVPDFEAIKIAIKKKYGSMNFENVNSCEIYFLPPSQKQQEKAL